MPRTSALFGPVPVDILSRSSNDAGVMILKASLSNITPSADILADIILVQNSMPILLVSKFPLPGNNSTNARRQMEDFGLNRHQLNPGDKIQASAYLLNATDAWQAIGTLATSTLYAEWAQSIYESTDFLAAFHLSYEEV